MGLHGCCSRLDAADALCVLRALTHPSTVYEIRQRAGMSRDRIVPVLEILRHAGLVQRYTRTIFDGRGRALSAEMVYERAVP